MRPQPHIVDKLADRTFIGALGFTSLGYRLRSRFWDPLQPNLHGRAIVITGATSGLGKAAAMRLATFGARLILVGRNPDKLAATLDELRRATGNENLHPALADLSSMDAVRTLAANLLATESEIHCLINNAGAMFHERQETPEGIELTLATNLLSHFLLTNLLLPRIRESAPARIINVSSGGMYTQGISLSNLQWEHGEYDGTRAYARTKRGQVILTEMWAEMLQGSLVTVNAMHPGWADTPSLEISLPRFRRWLQPLLRTPAEGADTIVWLAAAPEMAHASGGFYLDRTPHVTQVLPGTDLSRKERLQFWEQLAELSGWEGPGPTGD